jgi:hypothetical protein
MVHWGLQALEGMVDWGLQAIEGMVHWGLQALEGMVHWGLQALEGMVDWGLQALEGMVDWGLQAALTADAGPRWGEEVTADSEGSRGKDSTTTKHAVTASESRTSLTRTDRHTCSENKAKKKRN